MLSQNLLILARIVIEAQDIHGTNRDADSALDAGRVGVVEGFPIFGKGHDVDAHFAVGRALRATDALVVRANLQRAVPLGEHLHILRERAPHPAPDFTAKERGREGVHASEHFFKLENELFGFRIGSSLAYVAVD